MTMTMTPLFKHFAVATSVVLMLSACGKKDAQPGPPTTEAVNPAAASVPLSKNTEKFGSVSNIGLTPVFAVPGKYAAYVRQDLTEATLDEYRKSPDAAFEAYVKTWLTQAASSAKPDWDTLASIVYPEITRESNAFKKQEAAEKVQSTLPADKSSLNTSFGLTGEVLRIAGPDVSNGEYYLTINPRNRYQTVSYTNAQKYNYGLYYRPDFTALGMQGDRRGDMQITVKVPIEKAKQIEALRENTPMFMRVYGQVKGIKGFPVLHWNLVEAALEVDVEAIEFGVRKEGKFQTLFFLDSDQLKKAAT